MSTVEVIYATLLQQNSVRVELNAGDTIKDVILDSGLLVKYPEIDLTINKVGIYNQLKKLDDEVKVNDRIEIYRELIANPKDVRRKRAQKQKEQGIIN
ncbi:MAG: RnfH family protein [Alcanivoracaceae bacterium]|nr:RnfH family protein [Alcanivoracaceae bacterium]